MNSTNQQLRIELTYRAVQLVQVRYYLHNIHFINYFRGQGQLTTLKLRVSQK